MFRLLLSNHQSLKEKIPIKELPKTFQDAMEIAKKLGIEYLWIDSLCIIQDSPEDWRREASLMRDIFENCLCCIAATGSKSDGQGLLFERNPLLIQPLNVDIAPLKTREADLSPPWDGGLPSRGRYTLIDMKSWELHVENSPLTSRGWVYQELLLSPRTLHYGQYQVLWECRELRASEAHPEKILVQREERNPRGLKASDPVFEQKSKSYSGGLVQMSSERQEYSKRGFALWRDVVHNYSRLILTNPEDKLIAVSGIVKHIQEIVDDQYLAGLWRKDFAYWLLWQADNTTTSRPSGPYRAPSWSWASIDGKCGMHNAKASEKNEFWDDDLTTPPPTPPDEEFIEDEVLISVHDVHVEPVGDDATGQISDGRAIVMGQLAKAKIIDTYEAEEAGAESTFATLSCVIGPRESLPVAHLMELNIDVMTKELEPEVFCLPIVHKHSRSVLLGLMLVPDRTRPAIFRRYGMFFISEESLSNGIDVKTSLERLGKACRYLSEQANEVGLPSETVDGVVRHKITLV